MIILLLLTLATAENPPYHKIEHQTDVNAVCLDGSPAAMYLSEGDSSRILMYFMGGASCGANDPVSTLQSCYQRSKSVYGSSKYWPETNRFDGILSNDIDKNIFANWTKAVFLYCDGAFHQGSYQQAINYKGSKLYFRGGPITRSHLKFMDTQFSLKDAEKVVLAGGSAGAMASYIWADHVKSLLGSQTEYYVIPDSGIFLDPTLPQDHSLPAENRQKHPMVGTPNANLLFFSNKDENVPNQACAKVLGKDQEYHCLDIYTAYLYLESEALFLQSSYDHYLIRYFANFTCLKKGISGWSLQDCGQEVMDVLQNYRQYYLRFIQKLFERGHNIWTISCSWHSTSHFSAFYDSPRQKVPQTIGITMQEAAYNFVFMNTKVQAIDVEPWPFNDACAY